MVGPELLRHIWSENAPDAPDCSSYNQILPAGWRSNSINRIQDDSTMIGVPQYEDYAVNVSSMCCED